jgi:hypothetical protein
MAYGNTARDGTGDFLHLLQDSLGRLKVNIDWTLVLYSDENLNDSDKSFTVPAGVETRFKWIWVEYTSDVGAGNRQLEIQVQDDAADVIGIVRAGAVQAASLTRYYLFAQQATELTAFRDTDLLSTIMPEWILPAGYVVRIWDNKAISAAGDDMIIQIGVETRSI